MTTPNNSPAMHDTPHRIWIGYWLLAVAVLHTLYAGFPLWTRFCRHRAARRHQHCGA